MYYDDGTVILMGEFNAHLQSKTYIKPNDVRGSYLNNMLDYHILVAVNKLPICSCSIASFVSYRKVHKSLIDHILIPDVKFHLLLSCVITGDHVLRFRPVPCTLSLADIIFKL